MHASSVPNTDAAGPLLQRAAGLRSSVAKSHRCARDIHDSLRRFGELLDALANSPFVAHMRQLKASVVGCPERQGLGPVHLDRDVDHG
jgi:hypothetical protein